VTRRPCARSCAAAALAVAALLAAGAVPARAQGLDALLGRTVTELRLMSEGQPLHDAQVEGLLELRAGQPLTMALVRETIVHVMSMGQFLDVRVEASPAGSGVAVVIDVVPLREVRRLVFRGALGLPEAALRTAAVERFGPSPPVGRAADIARTVEDTLRGAGYLRAAVTPQPVATASAGDLVFDVVSGTRAEIGTLSYRGSPDAAVTELRSRVPLKVGSAYEPAELRKHLDAFADSLRARGYFEAAAEPLPRVSETGTRVDLILTVTQGPLVTVRFEPPDAVPQKLQADLVPVAREGSADQDLLEDSEVRITDFLRAQGYRDAKAPFTRNEAGGVLTVVFHVTRGPLYRVSGLLISGTSVLGDADIRPKLRVLVGQPFVQATLDADVAAVKAEYLKRGFANAAVTGAAVAVPGGAAAGEIPVTVTVSAVEGPSTVVSAVELKGVQAIPDAELLAALQTRAAGPIFGPTIEADKARILNQYLDRGYRLASVDATVSLDAGHSSAVVAFVVREGPQIMVDHVLVVGNSRISERTIRNEIVLESGQPLSSSALEESQRRLSALGLFRRIAITELQHDGQNVRDVLVSVEETPSTSVGFGGGVEYQRVETAEFAPRGFLELGRRNLWGKNRSINFFSRVSFRHRTDTTVSPADGTATVQQGQTDLEYRVVGSYREPRAFGTSADLQTVVAFEQGSRTSYSYRHRSARVDLAKRINASWNFLGQYLIQRNDIFEDRINPVDRPLIDRLFPQVRIGSVSGTAVHDTRDDALDPARGGLVSLNAELALRPIGSEVGFVKTFLQGFIYRQLPSSRRIVLAGGARLGLGTGFPRDVERTDADGNPIILPDGTPLTQEVRDLPASERFFAGGDTTVRGFQLDRLGRPETFDRDGTPIGGHAEFILNGEVRVAMWKDVGVVGFLDVGNVFQAVNDVRLGRLRGGSGFGIRYKSPVGPIRVDFGFKLGALQTFGVDREHRFALHISIGQAF
jgi:outer membrane protein insertion porin family